MKISHNVWTAFGSWLNLLKKKWDNQENFNTGWIFEGNKEFCDSGICVYLLKKIYVDIHTKILTVKMIWHLSLGVQLKQG